MDNSIFLDTDSMVNTLQAIVMAVVRAMGVFATQISVEIEGTDYCQKTMVFTRLIDELNVTWSDESPEIKRKLRRTPNVYFIIRVFEEFLEKHQRRPSTNTLEADSKELQNLRLEILNKLSAPVKMIPEDFYEYGFGELSPVCAIVGGVLTQEIIKAVSQKDAPHNNFFFYSGLNDNGIVDKFTS